jgi:hypothetical protein
MVAACFAGIVWRMTGETLTAETPTSVNGAQLGQRNPIFQKLVALSGQRDPETGFYAASARDSPLDQEGFEIERALRHRHASIFRGWMSLPSQEQEADFSSFISRTRVADRVMLATVLRAACEWGTLVPDDAAASEREAFRTGLTRLLSLTGPLSAAPSSAGVA